MIFARKKEDPPEIPGKIRLSGNTTMLFIMDFDRAVLDRLRAIGSHSGVRVEEAAKLVIYEALGFERGG